RRPRAGTRGQSSCGLTLVHLNRSARPADVCSTDVLGIDRDSSSAADQPGGTTTLRLPKGRYLISGMVLDGEGPDRRFSMMVQPILDLSRSLTLTLDARRARPVSAKVPRADATQLVGNVGFSMHLGVLGFSALLFGHDFTGFYTAQLGPTGTTPGFVSNISGQWGRAKPDGNTRNSPYAYLLSWFQSGRFTTGFQRTVAAGDLASVHVDMAAEA